MRKTYQVTGYAVNRRGHTVGIHYTLTATSESAARSTAQQLATEGGYNHIRITLVQEAGNV
jgi:hypothetical protein